MSRRIECGSLEFAFARIQARHGQRIDEPAWKRIEVVRGLAPMLVAARGTALRPWLEGIGADSGPLQIEALLRGQALALVDELAAWLPAPWQPALDWCALLPELPLLQHQARGGAWPTDLQADPRRAALAPALAEPQRIGAVWLAEFGRLLPAAARQPEHAMSGLIRLLQDHLEAFALAAAGQGWPQRAALRARLHRLLRRVGVDAAAAFIHLALCALDLERLRAELLRRACFPRWAVA